MSFLKNYIARGKRTAWRIYGDKVIILLMPSPHHKRLEIFEFSGMGTCLWKLLENGIRVEEFIQHIAKIKKAEPQSLKLEVLRFIRKRVREGLIDIIFPPGELA